MTYAARTDLEERYGAEEMAQRESVLTAGAVERSLTDADAEIDSYLAGRYETPITPVPVVLTRIACAIARYHLLGDSATEIARKAYEDALRFLRDVQAGKAVLDGASMLPGGSSGMVQMVSYGRNFTRDAM